MVAINVINPLRTIVPPSFLMILKRIFSKVGIIEKIKVNGVKTNSIRIAIFRINCIIAKKTKISPISKASKTATKAYENIAPQLDFNMLFLGSFSLPAISEILVSSDPSLTL